MYNDDDFDNESLRSVPGHRTSRSPRGILKFGREQTAKVFKRTAAFRLPKRDRPSEDEGPGEPDVVAVRQKRSGGYLRAFLFGAPKMRRERTDDYEEEEEEDRGVQYPQTSNGTHMPEPIRMPMPGGGISFISPEQVPPNVNIVSHEDSFIDESPSPPRHKRLSFTSRRHSHRSRGSDSPPNNMPIPELSSPTPSAPARRVVHVAPDIPSPSAQGSPTSHMSQFSPRRPSRREIVTAPALTVQPVDLQSAETYRGPRTDENVAYPAGTHARSNSHSHSPPFSPPGSYDLHAAYSQQSHKRTHESSQPLMGPPTIQASRSGRPRTRSNPDPGMAAPTHVRFARTLHDISNYPWMNREYVTAEYHPGSRTKPATFVIPDTVAGGSGLESWYAPAKQAHEKSVPQSHYAPRRAPSNATTAPGLEGGGYPAPSRPTVLVQNANTRLPQTARPPSVVSIPAPAVPPKSPRYTSPRLAQAPMQAMVVFPADGTPRLQVPPGMAIPRGPIQITGPDGQTAWYQPAVA